MSFQKFYYAGNGISINGNVIAVDPALDELSSLADSNALVIFDNNGHASTLPYSLDSATYLDGSGNWTTPSGGGGTVTQVEDGSSNVIVDGPDAQLNDFGGQPSITLDDRRMSNSSGLVVAGWGVDPINSEPGFWIKCGTGDSRSLTLVDLNAGGGGSAGTVQIQFNYGGQYITFDNATQIKNVADPIDQQDVATKNYVDGAIPPPAVSRQTVDADITGNTLDLSPFSGIANSDLVIYCSTSDTSDIENINNAQFNGQIIWFRSTRGGTGPDPSPNSVLISGNIRTVGGANLSTIFGSNGQLGLMYDDATGNWYEISRKEYDS
jgi:hypothetical protein